MNMHELYLRHGAAMGVRRKCRFCQTQQVRDFACTHCGAPDDGDREPPGCPGVDKLAESP